MKYKTKAIFVPVSPIAYFEESYADDFSIYGTSTCIDDAIIAVPKSFKNTHGLLANR